MDSEVVVIRRHDTALDGVRGFAILSVVGFHLDYIRGGFIGVGIFFVLSGFLITTILHTELEKTGQVDYAVFYVRRLLRLIPALAVCLVGVSLYYIFTSKIDAEIAPLVAAATYSMNYLFAYGIVGESLVGHTWSLAVEMQFYLVWPLLFSILFRRMNYRWILAVLSLLAVACAIWRAVVSFRYGQSSVDFTYRVLETQSDSLLIGCMTALMIRSGKAFCSRIMFAAACTFLLVVLWRVPAGKLVFHEFGFILVALAAAYIIGFLVSARSGAVRAVFENPAICYLGRISYGIYLYHYPIVEVLRQRGISHLPIWASVLSFAAAALSFHFIERPFLRLKPAVRSNRKLIQASYG